MAEGRQREVRRGQAQVLAAAAVFDQLFQLFTAELCKLFHLSLSEHFVAEGPGHVQAVVVDLAVEGQPVAQWRIGAFLFADRVAAGGEQGAVVAIEAAVELAQVVEGNAWLGQGLELLADRRVAQVAQGTIANAFVGYCTQLLFDGLD
ncbi:hypothetical protein D3C77_581920 [compost metagenome]